MSVNLQYVASSGNVYNLKAEGIRSRDANYHEWDWVANGTQLQFGQRISNFKRDPIAYDTTLLFYGSQQYRKAMIEALHEDFELDVRNMSPGRVIWGDYYIDCYVSASSTEPDENLLWTDNKITFFCPYPFWIREEKKTFMPQEEIVGQEYLDYPYDYAYDYYYQPGFQEWIRDFPFATEFRMIIYGACADPQVTINGHMYKVYDTLAATDYIVIDSRNHTVMKYLGNGQKVNIFDNRNKAQSVFKQIPPGRLVANWSGAFGFDLILFEERSEPRWDDNRYGDLTGNDADLQVERW